MSVPSRKSRPFHYRDRVSVKFTDPATGQSTSFTVYGVDPDQLASWAWNRFRARYGLGNVTERGRRRLRRLNFDRV